MSKCLSILSKAAVHSFCSKFETKYTSKQIKDRCYNVELKIYINRNVMTTTAEVSLLSLFKPRPTAQRKTKWEYKCGTSRQYPG